MHVRVRTPLLGVLVVALAAPAMAQGINGAIYTTIKTGTNVNGNIYDAKEDVYLNGGPQNEHKKGLDPDGVYYFQVTDPSGTQLLSTDDIACRQVVVADGKVVGVPSVPTTCTPFHPTGTPNASNGQTPVQLLPFEDTPNSGGEYKVWITTLNRYGNLTCKPGHASHGFCDNDSKTDNFKVRQATAAYVNVCKFNDFNGNGTQDLGEPFIAHWPITAEGVDNGPVTTQTNDDGCVSFTYS